MTRARMRWFVVAALLAVASSVASRHPAPAPAAPSIVKLAMLVPPILTTSWAQQPGQVAGCTGKAVAGNQFTITVEQFKAVTTGGTDVLITDTASSVNFAGADGAATAEKFFTGQSFTAGSYNKLKVTVSPTLTIKGYVSCVISAQTRWYYTDGNPNPHASAFVLTEAAAQAAVTATAIKFGGGSGTSFTAEIPVNFTVTAGQTTTLNMAVPNEGAFALYDLSGINGLPANSYMVFPGQPNPSSANAQ